MADVSIRYNNTEIATMSSSGTKVLKTEATSCYTDVTVKYIDPEEINPKKDGLTHIYLTIPPKSTTPITIPLYWNQSIANGVEVNWGDGTAPFTVNGTGNITSMAHEYQTSGHYEITLERKIEECDIKLGTGNSGTGLLGDSSITANTVRGVLSGVETGNGVSTIQAYCFCRHAGIRKVLLGKDITTIGNYGFAYSWGIGSIHFLGPLPANGNIGATNVWSEIQTWCKIYVPAAYINASGAAQNIPSRMPSTSTYAYAVEPDAYTV